MGDEDGRTPPIEEEAYLAGVTVVDFGDFRVSRGLTRRATSSCAHARVSYDARERRVWCRDCENDVEPFDAFVRLIEQVDRERKRLEAKAKQIAEAEQFTARSLAARAIDKAWRSRSMVPACPHCHNGLFPEDFKAGGFARVSKEFAAARLGRKA